MEKRVNLEFREFLEGQDQWGHQGTKVQWEIRDLKVRQEFLDHLGHVEIRGKMDPQEFPVLRASLDLLEREEWLAHLAQEVSRECQVRQGRTESLAEMEQLGCKVRQE